MRFRAIFKSKNNINNKFRSLRAAAANPWYSDALKRTHAYPPILPIEAMITLTDAAVEHLKDMLAGDGDEAGASGRGLRLLVQSGGCAGMQYAMKLDHPAGGDAVFERDGVRVFIDPGSHAFLEGVLLDYNDALTDSGFKIVNPNAARSCGCGTSFEPAVAGKAPEYDASRDGSVCGESAPNGADGADGTEVREDGNVAPGRQRI